MSISRQRSGFAIVVVIVGIVVVATIASAMIQSVPQTTMELRRQEARQQTQILGKCAWLRARRKLNGSSDYTGERLSWLQGELGHPTWSADVHIEVRRDERNVRCLIRVSLYGSDRLVVRWNRDFPIPTDTARPSLQDSTQL